MSDQAPGESLEAEPPVAEEPAPREPEKAEDAPAPAEAAPAEKAAPGAKVDAPGAEADAPAAEATAAAAAAPTGEMWVYLDKQGAVQGPFAKDQIRSWYAGGYLEPTLKIKPEGGAEFKDLQDVPELQAPQAAAPAYDGYGGGGAANGGDGAAPGPIEVPEGKRLGEVKSWNDDKGFGFIIPDGVLPPSLARTTPKLTLLDGRWR